MCCQKFPNAIFHCIYRCIETIQHIHCSHRRIEGDPPCFGRSFKTFIHSLNLELKIVCFRFRIDNFVLLTRERGVLVRGGDRCLTVENMSVKVTFPIERFATLFARMLLLKTMNCLLMFLESPRSVEQERTFNALPRLMFFSMMSVEIVASRELCVTHFAGNHDGLKK